MAGLKWNTGTGKLYLYLYYSTVVELGYQQKIYYSTVVELGYQQPTTNKGRKLAKQC